MQSLYFITHPEVVVDPEKPVERWHLSPQGIERMRIFAGSPVLENVRSIWSSTEAKAIEAAGILGGALGLGVSVCGDLGENDRSATGFLPPTEFEATADRFFAAPEESVRGWERAVDAQERVHNAVSRIVSGHGADRAGGDLAIVAHGAVGTLLYCALSGLAIDRTHDQPFQGHFWKAALPQLKPDHGWREIVARF